jgi:glycosyltransferase involved in cell wall biosynthesis
MEAKQPTLTVFTPAYNRAHTIGRTYESLCRQTCKDFEWLVVDDGSTDNTRDLVEQWINEGRIAIRYVYQANQGMHGAHNTAYKNISSELNTCIDSDDYMPDEAVEKIIRFWHEHKADDIAGIVGLDITEDNKVIGSLFEENNQRITLTDYYDRGGSGDKKSVYRTDIIHLYPDYPLFKGERYVSLASKYFMIDQDYEMLTLNEPLVVVEYQTDGSSMNMYKQYWRNPQGFIYDRQLVLSKHPKLKKRIRYTIHYISSKLIARQYNIVGESYYPILTTCLLPFGFMLYAYIRHCVKSNKQMKI